MIRLKDSNETEQIVQEGESANITATFHFGDNTFDKDAILSLVASLYNQDTKEIINSWDELDVLDDNNATVATNGTLTLRLGPSENAIIGDLSDGDVESHVLRLKWTWNDGTAVRTGIEELVFQVEKKNTLV